MQCVAADDEPGRIAVVVKGYPRLSETFIAQEILALEAARARRSKSGRCAIRPSEPSIRCTGASRRAVTLPAGISLRGAAAGAARLLLEPAAAAASAARCASFWRDLKRDLTRQPRPAPRPGFRHGPRARAATSRHLHVHYLHTPASVVRYAALLTGRTWTFSAHAKDIWTTPDWEKREKLAERPVGRDLHGARARSISARLLRDPSRVALVYHGLDLSRFPAAARAPPGAGRLRSGRSRPHRLGRAGGREEGL